MEQCSKDMEKDMDKFMKMVDIVAMVDLENTFPVYNKRKENIAKTETMTANISQEFPLKN